LGGGGNIPSDPRSRVVIDDCTIFDNQNIDRYPPSLDVLVNGVQVRPRGLNMNSGSGLRDGEQQATEINGDTDEVTKHYLREMPVDPMTGDTKWNIRSSYQEPGSGSWDEINVFDIRSTSDEEGLNGEKYSDW
jgi:general secretion pathway protein G